MFLLSEWSSTTTYNPRQHRDVVATEVLRETSYVQGPRWPRLSFPFYLGKKLSTLPSFQNRERVGQQNDKAAPTKLALPFRCLLVTRRF